MADNKNLEKVKKWGADNLTGLLAIIAGLILLVITYKIILNLIVFSCGAMLVYFGFARLKIKQVTDFMDKIRDWLRKIFFAQ